MEVLDGAALRNGEEACPCRAVQPGWNAAEGVERVREGGRKVLVVRVGGLKIRPLWSLRACANEGVSCESNQGEETDLLRVQQYLRSCLAREPETSHTRVAGVRQATRVLVQDV